MNSRASRSAIFGTLIVAGVAAALLLVRGGGAPVTVSEPPSPAPAESAPTPPALGAPPRGAPVVPAHTAVVRRLAVHIKSGRVPPAPGTLVWFQGHPETEGSPDVTGNVELFVPEGPSRLVGRLADGHWARTTVPSDAVRAELVFGSAVSLAGTVRAPDGSPLAGFRLRVYGLGARDPTRRDPALRDYDRRAEVVEATTDVAGAFEVRGLESIHVELESGDAESQLLGWDGIVSAKIPSEALELIADRVCIVQVQCVDARTDFPVTCHTVAVTNWPPGYTASLIPAFPPRQILKFPWPAAALRAGTPVVEFLASGYLPHTAQLDASVPVEDGVSTIRLDRDPSAPAVGAIRFVASGGFDFGRLESIDLIERSAEEHVRYWHPVTVRGQRYLVGLPIGEFKVRVLGRTMDSTVLVRAGETTDLTLMGPTPAPVVLRPRLGEHAIGGRILCLLMPDASKVRADGSRRNASVISTLLQVGAEGTAALGVLAPGAYSVTIARDTDSGNTTFTVPEAGSSSEPIVIDVPMVARSAFGDWSK